MPWRQSGGDCNAVTRLHGRLNACDFWIPFHKLHNELEPLNNERRLEYTPWNDGNYTNIMYTLCKPLWRTSFLQRILNREETCKAWMNNVNFFLYFSHKFLESSKNEVHMGLLSFFFDTPSATGIVGNVGRRQERKHISWSNHEGFVFRVWEELPRPCSF